MKRRIIAALVMFAVLGSASVTLASLVENNTNLSAEWTRMPSRVGLTDSVDTALYNPAGSVRLGEGVFVLVSNQTMPKKFTHTKDGIAHKTTTTTPFVPGLFVMKNGQNWSLFTGTTVIGGGGTLEYKNGILNKKVKALGQTASQMAGLPIRPEEVSSAWLGGYIGGACAVSDQLSFSVAARVVHGEKTYEIDGGALLDFETTGTGLAPIVGINYSPSPTVNIGFRHEFRTAVEWEVDRIEGALAVPFSTSLGTRGTKSPMDFPALTALGVSFKPSDTLTLASDISYIWHDDVDWSGREKGLDNAYEVTLAGEYAATKNLRVSAGYSYGDSGMDKENYNPALSKNRFHGISAGFKVKTTDALGLGFGVTRFFYLEDTDRNGITYEKELWIIGTSLEYRF